MPPRRLVSRARGRTVFPRRARYLCDRRVVQNRLTGRITAQYLMLLDNDDHVWVVEAAIQNHADNFDEPHWDLNINLLIGWVVSGRQLDFIHWAGQQGYVLFFDRFIRVADAVEFHGQVE